MLLGRVVVPVGVSIAAVVALAPSATATRGEASSAQEPVRLNRIIEQFEAGEPAIGGRHWQYIGFEHRPYRIDEVVRILDELLPDGAARPTLTPVIRFSWEGDKVVKSMVKQVLDQGVMGVIVPHVDTAEDTRRFVRAMRYPPQRGAKYPEPRGVRGWGPVGLLADDDARVHSESRCVAARSRRRARGDRHDRVA